MTGPTDSEKRKMFTDVLQRILAIEFPNEYDNPKKIHLLFHDEENLKVAVFFLQDYVGIGFSLIIEKIDNERINLKIYEPETDDFHVCERVTIRTNILDFYQEADKEGTFLSVGLLELVDSQPNIRTVSFLNIPIKSITFQDVA